jgi:phosphonoacetaldehyde hydrolase
MSDILVVDDTPVGIAAGRNSGCQTVAVSKTGNALGLSEAEVAALDPAELKQRLATIEQDFLKQGASYVIPLVADLPKLLARIMAA